MKTLLPPEDHITHTAGGISTSIVQMQAFLQRSYTGRKRAVITAWYDHRTNNGAIIELYGSIR